MTTASPREAPGLLDRARAYLRRSSLDESDAEGRSHERYRRALLSGLTSTAARGVGVLGTLVSIPLTLGYLGVERFGVWMTLSSFGALMAFTDFGLGNGLLNAVAAADARGDSAQVRRYVSTALLALAAISLLVLFAWTAFGGMIPWTRVLAVPAGSPVADEVRGAMTVFVMCLALGIPAAVVQRVQAALQMGYVASFWQLAASALSLTGIVLVVLVKGSLAWLALAAFGAPVLVNAINSVVFWGVLRRTQKPSPVFVRREELGHLLRSGSLFFVLQLAASFAFASDNLIVAQLLGPAAVAKYSVVAQLFEGLILLLGMFLMPLWPAYAEAAARGDTRWVERTLRRSLQLTAIVLVLSVTVLAAISKPVIELWVGTAAGYSIALVAAYGAWAVAKGIGSAIAAFLNGMNILRFQVVLALAFTAASIAAKIGLASQFGLAGLPLALLLTYSLVVLLPYGVLLRRMFGSRE